jgi:hypothetical protein
VNGISEYVTFRKPCEGGGNCVEVAVAELVMVRDSKNPDGPVLVFGKTEWSAFVRGVKAGEFDIC